MDELSEHSRKRYGCLLAYRTLPSIALSTFDRYGEASEGTSHDMNRKYMVERFIMALE